MNKQLIDQAIDALTWCHEEGGNVKRWDAIAALRAERDKVVDLWDWKPTDAAIQALKRFDETCEDGEGYDVSKDTMRQLAIVGLVYQVRPGFYGMTDFGNYILTNQSKQPEQRTGGCTLCGHCAATGEKIQAVK